LSNRGRKRFIKLGVSISTNRPSLDGLDLDDCSSMPQCGDAGKQHAEKEMEEEKAKKEAEEKTKMEAEMEAMRQQLEQMKAQQVRRVSSV
jgi:hypothetical protein